MSSLEINVDTRDFIHLQAALAQISDKDLDKLLRGTVNAVGTKADKMIRQQVASELGISESLIQQRLILNKSDSRPHTVRSAWLWMGTQRLASTRLGKLDNQWIKSKIKVGKYLVREGFQKVNQGMRVPLDITNVAQQVIERITPTIPALLEKELGTRLSKHLQVL